MGNLLELTEPRTAATERWSVIVDEFNHLREAIVRLLKETGGLNSCVPYSDVHKHLRESLRAGYEDGVSGLQALARKRFEAAGIDHIKFATKPHGGVVLDWYSAIPEAILSVDLAQYWKDLLAQELHFKRAGEAKHAAILANDLFGWDRLHPEDPKQQKQCIVFPFYASVDGLFLKPAYRWDDKARIMGILDSISHVAHGNALDSLFFPQTCEEALGNFEARNRVKFCDHCEIETFNSSVKFRLSYPLAEAIQIYVSEFGHEPPPSC